MNAQEWTSYQQQQPTEAGPYWWRLKSGVLPDLTLNFVAHMRKRGTCGEDILSPSFDHWTGWQVQVPICEWRPYEGEPTGKLEYEQLCIEGLTFEPCPFCKTIPKLQAWQECSGGGFIAGPSPVNYNLWRLKCCAWGSTPNGRDPRELERFRKEAYSLPRVLTWTTNQPTAVGTYGQIRKDKTVDMCHYFVPPDTEDCADVAYWIGPLPSMFAILCGMSEEAS